MSQSKSPGGLGKKVYFLGDSGVYSLFFYLNGPLNLSEKVSNPIMSLFKNKKVVVALKKLVI